MLLIVVVISLLALYGLGVAIISASKEAESFISASLAEIAKASISQASTWEADGKNIRFSFLRGTNLHFGVQGDTAFVLVPDAGTGEFITVRLNARAYARAKAVCYGELPPAAELEGETWIPDSRGMRFSMQMGENLVHFGVHEGVPYLVAGDPATGVVVRLTERAYARFEGEFFRIHAGEIPNRWR